MMMPMRWMMNSMAEEEEDSYDIYDLGKNNN